MTDLALWMVENVNIDSWKCDDWDCACECGCLVLYIYALLGN